MGSSMLPAPFLAAAAAALVILVLHVVVGAAQDFDQDGDLPHYNCNDKNGNYTRNSTYQTNLRQLLSSLSSRPQLVNGFYNFSAGRNPDQVNAIGLCRGDIDATLCGACIDKTGRELLQHCPKQKEAIGWDEGCMLRYSSRDIFGVMEENPRFRFYNQSIVSRPVQFNLALDNLLDSLIDKAASGRNSLGKLATGSVRMNNDSQMTIYGLVQCTPDLPQQSCRTCLKDAFSTTANGSERTYGWRTFFPSCRIRYELTQFFQYTAANQQTPSEPPPPAHGNNDPSAPPTSDNKSSRARRMLVIVIPTVLFALLVILVLSFSYLRPRKLMEKVATSEADGIKRAEIMQFDLGTVEVATDNFSLANKLGHGGYGEVYKGRLPNGHEIAVKRLSMNSQQGDAEFKNEVLLLAELQHRNLVRLLGYCLEGRERILIYELVANGGLDQYIFDPGKRAHLGWDTCFKIIQGIARGLLYLHEDSRLRIIHRDMKASNILLDINLNPKISDFGMARLFALDETQAETRKVVGTPGYIAPEYAAGHFSVKSDVFSFGVLLLEIVSGQRTQFVAEDEEGLLTRAWETWTEGTPSNLLDPTLRGGSSEEVARCIHIGLLCVQERATDRPTMASVVNMLNNSNLSLPVCSRPAFYMQGPSSRQLKGNQFASDP